MVVFASCLLVAVLHKMLYVDFLNENQTDGEPVGCRQVIGIPTRSSVTSGTYFDDDQTASV